LPENQPVPKIVIDGGDHEVSLPGKPMDDNEVLRRIIIPTPCPRDWKRMVGDDRVRFCATCGKHVHNFATMTSDEAVALIRAQGGDLCGLLSRRPDGTLITSDCQPEPQPRSRLWQFNIRSLMALIAGLAAAFGYIRMISRTTVVTAGRICKAPPAVQTITNPPNAVSGPDDQESAEAESGDQEIPENPNE
jgi:hypothetical protein